MGGSHSPIAALVDRAAGISHGGAMPRITPIDPAVAAPPAAAIFEQQKETWGAVLGPYQLYARRPSLLLAVRGMWDALGESGLLPQTLASLVCRRVAALNGCVF